MKQDSWVPQPPHLKRVQTYYDKTKLDYILLWRGRSLGLHFGYWGEHVTGHEESLITMNAFLADRVGISQEDRVLDAGCGVGGSAVWLASTIGCSVVGISIVPHQVDEAKKFSKQLGLSEKARFALADFANTGFPPQSFDVVWLLESLVHAQHKQIVLQEAFRLLRPGGRVVIAEYVLSRELPPDEEKKIRFFCDAWAMSPFLTTDIYQKYIHTAGFQQITAEDISVYVQPSLRRLWRMSRFSLPIARVFNMLGIFSRERLRNVEGSVMQYETFQAKSWKYMVFAARKPL